MNKNDGCDLELLPFRVCVATVDRVDIRQVAFLFIQHLLRRGKSEPFFHLTTTDFECSLYVEERMLSLLADKEKVRISPHKWMAFRLEDTSLLSTPGVIHEISRILADNYISIMNMSTYDTNYTFIREDQMAQGIKILSNNGFSLTVGKEHLPSFESSTCSDPGRDDEKDSKVTRTHSLPLYEFRDRLAVCILNEADLFHVSSHLIQQIFVEPHVSFFSFTETQEEITVVIPEVVLKVIPQLRPCVESWHVFTAVTPDTGIEDFGILESVTKPFKEGAISVFVLSTYRAVNVLVEVSAHQNALNALTKSKIIRLKSHV